MASATRWLEVQLEHIWVAGVASIRLTTNNPVHLFLRYTYQEPVKTSIPMAKRGTFWYADLKYCFVEWAECEQDEAGDTLVHTFSCDIFPYCVPVWYIFRGTVSSENSPSNTAIYKAHNPWPAPPPPAPCAFSLAYTAQEGPGETAAVAITTSHVTTVS